MKNTLLLLAMAVASLALGACASKKCCKKAACCADKAAAHSYGYSK